MLENNALWPRPVCSVCSGPTRPQLVWPSVPASSACLSDSSGAGVDSTSFVAGLCNICDHVQNSWIIDQGLPSTDYSSRDYVAKRSVSNTMSQLLQDVKLWILATTGIVDLRGVKILEIGSGQGELARHFADLGAVVYTVDPSVCDYDHPGIVHHSGIFDSEYPHSSFDLVIARHVLEHLVHPGQLLRLIQTRIKPQGWLYLETPNGRIALDRFRPLDYFADHIQHFSPNSLSRLVRDAGWQVCQGRTWLEDNHLALVAKPGQQDHFHTSVGYDELANLLGRSLRSFQQRLARINAAESLIIYGAGAHAVTLAHILPESTRARVQAVWDRDTAKHGRYLPGISVPITGIGTSSAELIVNTGVLYPREIADYLRDQLGLNIEILQLEYRTGFVTGPTNVD